MDLPYRLSHKLLRMGTGVKWLQATTAIQVIAIKK